MLSYILETVLSKVMPLYLLQSLVSPFLCIGTITPVFQSSGTLFVCQALLNNFSSSPLPCLPRCIIISGVILSWPADFPLFSLPILSSISSIVTISWSSLHFLFSASSSSSFSLQTSWLRCSVFNNSQKYSLQRCILSWLFVIITPFFPLTCFISYVPLFLKLFIVL